MFCPNCGKQISDQAKFCPNCGAQIRLHGSLTQDQSSGAEGRTDPQEAGKTPQTNKVRITKEDQHPEAAPKMVKVAKKEKPQTKSGVGRKFKKVLIGIAVILILIIAGRIALQNAANAYRKPIDRTVAMLNARETDLDEISDRLLPAGIQKDVSEIIRMTDGTSLGVDNDYYAAQLEDTYEQFNNSFGEKYKLTCTIASKKRMSRDALKHKQEVIRSMAADKDPVYDENAGKQLEETMGISNSKELFDHVTAVNSALKDAKVTNGYYVYLSLSPKGEDNAYLQLPIYVGVLKLNGSWVLDPTVQFDYIPDWAGILARF